MEKYEEKTKEIDFYGTNKENNLKHFFLHFIHRNLIVR